MPNRMRCASIWSVWSSNEPPSWRLRSVIRDDSFCFFWIVRSDAGWGDCVCSDRLPPRPPKYELLRQDEDYRYLGNPTCRDDYWDRAKYVRLGSNADTFFTLGGEIREWYEGYRNASRGFGPQDTNGYLLQRLSIYSDIHAASRIRLFVQLTSDICPPRMLIFT